MLEEHWAAALLSTGCSFLFVERAPANHKQLAGFDCTTNVAAPVLDVVWGGLNLAGAISASSADDRTWNGPGSRSATVAVGVGWAVLSALSAGYGFTNTNQCRDAKADLYARLARQNAGDTAVARTFRPAPPRPAAAAQPPPAGGTPRTGTAKAAISAATAVSGCEKDTDCKGERICERHECVYPQEAAKGAWDVPAPVPAPQAVSPKSHLQVARAGAPGSISAQTCAPLGTAALVTGSEIHAGPDANTATVATLDHLTPACVGTEKQGFGFRRVLLADGTGGFVEDSFISDLTRPLAPPSPGAVPAPVALAPAPVKMSAQDCSPLVPAFAAEGASVHAGPDTQTKILVWLDAVTPVCAATDSQGFGMRLVQLPDSTEGFVKESDLSE